MRRLAHAVSKRSIELRRFLRAEHKFTDSNRGASTGRTRWTRGTQTGTADYHISSSDLESLRGQHRDNDRNNVIFSGVLNRWIDNVVGPGWTFQARTDDEGANKALEARVQEYTTSEIDYTGRFGIVEMLQIMLREVACGGDMLFAKVQGQLQPIEADLCLTPAGKYFNSNINNGVEKDPTGRVVKYHIGQWTAYGNVSSSDTTPVDAGDIFHLFRPKRFSQSRCLPIFSGALELFERLDDYIEATLVAAQVGACQSAVITTAEGSSFGVDNANDEEASDGETVYTEEMEPGLRYYLRPGEDVKMIAPEQPTTQFEPFIRALLRFVGQELGMPLELVTLDYSDVNYSSARAALLQAQLAFRGWQAMIENRLLYPLVEWLLPTWCAQIGLAYDSGMDYLWVPPGWQWVDPMNEVQANVEATSNGLKSLQQIASEQGYYWRDMLTQRAAEIAAAQEIAESAGVEGLTWRDIVPSKEEKPAPQGFGQDAPAEEPEAEEEPAAEQPAEPEEEPDAGE